MTSHHQNDVSDVELDSDNDVVIGPFFAALAGKLSDPELISTLHERHDALREESSRVVDGAV